MEKKLITTSDGSHTFLVENWKETYHSKFGAIKEAYHVFIDRGFHVFEGDTSILEVGFGTGLNAFITFLEAEKTGRKICYDAVEAFPLKMSEVKMLNYVDQLEVPYYNYIFEFMHICPWEKQIAISENFTLEKRLQRFQDINDISKFDIIYYDAFGANVQPDLWENSIFQKMLFALKPGGILVTYASKTSARLAMEKVGFKVEKLIGSAGKREMLRAKKLIF